MMPAPQVEPSRKVEDRALGISVIMPVYNGCGFIEHSLPPLMRMLAAGEVLEVLVVDDGSSDASVATATELGARVLPSGGRLGAGGARNVAAEVARGELLWFVDADVVVHADAVGVLLQGFEEPGVVGVFGSYDDQPAAQNFLSQYKNLVHHFYHHKASREASTFWSGCGAVRREIFRQHGGFDVERYKRPSIEDIELGYRLRDAGGRLLLLSGLLCKHLKVWRFGNLMHTEIFCRAIPWSRLMLERGGLDDGLNVGIGERLRALLALGFWASWGLVWLGLGYLWVPLAFALAVLLANLDLARLFLRRKGLGFAFAGLLFHQWYYVYSSFAFAWAYLQVQWLRHRA